MRVRARCRSARAPLLGEHTEEVLADVLGLSSREIGRLHDDGVVAGPKKQTLERDDSSETWGLD